LDNFLNRMIILAGLKKYWHWVFLGGGLLSFAIHYMPAVYLNGLNSDMLIPVVFYQDIVQQGHPCQGWVWGGASFLFPDLFLVWTLNFLSGDGLLAAQVATTLFALGWIVILSLAYRASNGRHSEVFTALAVLLALGVASHDGINLGLSMNIFLPVCHGGGMLMTMGCFAVAQYLWLRGYSRLFWLLGLLAALGAASDALFILTFTAPAIGALALATLWYPARVRLALMLAGNILLCSALGFLLLSHLFPVTLSSGYTGLRLDAALDSLNALWQSLDFSHNAARTVLFCADVLVVFLCAAVLLYGAPWNRARVLSPAVFFVAAFGGLLIIADWGGSILTGNYTGIDASRYVMCAYACPWMLLIGCLSEWIAWTRWATQILFFAVSALMVTVTLSPPPVAGYYHEAKKLVPVLRSVMAQEHIEAGLSDYWNANCFTFLSRQTVPIRGITDHGAMRRWFNNLQWYAGDGVTQAPPSFRFIIMRRMNSQAITSRYGPPARIIQTLDDLDIWIYSPEDAIRYSPIFGDLGNRHCFVSPTQFWISTAGLPSSTGKVENGSMIARAGRDKESFMDFGPYLCTQSGRYRVDFVYG
jgi:hypothetical protein